MAGIRVTAAAKSGRELRAVARRLRTADPSLRRKLPAGLRRAARPGLAELRRAARGIPADGPKSRGTRRLMAANTVLSARASGVQYRGKPLPGDRRALPVLFEGLRPWRKPLFGDRERWYPQAAHPWFYPTAGRQEGRFRRACEQVIDDVIAELGG